MTILADRYRKGIGCVEDVAQADEWQRKAAEAAAAPASRVAKLQFEFRALRYM